MKVIEILEDLKPDTNFKDSLDFVEDGLLDSLGLMILIEKLEDLFRIEIDPLEIEEKDFKSVNAIIELIKKNGGEVNGLS